MITKEKAVEIAIEYASARKRNYIYIEKERVNYEKNKYINYGKYYEQKRDVYTITCHNEGYIDPISNYIIVDAKTGEVLYTMTPHGYAEDWE